MKGFILILFIFIAGGFLFTNTGCYYDNLEALHPTDSTSVTCDTASVKYSSYIAPLLAAQCNTSGCHNARDLANGSSFADYNSLKTYLTSQKARFIGSIEHVSPYIYMPLTTSSKLPDCDIQKINSWIKAGYANN